MSVPARILRAVSIAALVIVPLVTASPAGSAIRASQANPMVVETGVGPGAGTWEQHIEDGPPGGRSFYVYTPPGLAPAKPVPLVVVLHGCRQSADLALGSGVNGLADRKGFVAVYPEQGIKDNPRRCWNWFDVRDQFRGFGEPAAIARITEQVLRRPGAVTLDRSRVYVMGMSAGGAMAGILAVTYPDLYAAVGIHSALEYGAAQNLVAAYLAMRHGGPDPKWQGLLAYGAMGPRARVVPAIVFQGGADQTVWPVNGDRVVRQWLTTSRLASCIGDRVGLRPAADPAQTPVRRGAVLLGAHLERPCGSSGGPVLDRARPRTCLVRGRVRGFVHRPPRTQRDRGDVRLLRPVHSLTVRYDRLRPRGSSLLDTFHRPDPEERVRCFRRHPLAARVATAATSDFTSDAAGGVPMLMTSTPASINGPVMKARLA